MNIARMLFCCAALAASFLVAKVAFPLAALPSSTIENAQTPQEPELFDDIELEDFGAVPVLDMVQYYIDNPPDTPVEGSGKKVRFQGC